MTDTPPAADVPPVAAADDAALAPDAPVVVAADLAVERGGQRVLRDVRFEAKAGDFVAVVGPNGAGKTTLLKTLMGLVPPAAGTVHLLGSPPHDGTAGLVGYVPQIKTLDRSFPARGLDLVAAAVERRWPFGRGAFDRARAALRDVGAEALADRALSTLSGGELQRVYLARSLVRAPRLVLLDEPATGIDAAGAADFYDLLDAYQAEHDATVVMVTHDWNAAAHHATAVLVLDRRQVAFGPPEEALSEETLRAAFGHVGHAHAMLGGA